MPHAFCPLFLHFSTVLFVINPHTKSKVCSISHSRDIQVAQLSQRDNAAGWVSFGQKWKTGTGRPYFVDIGLL